MRNMPNGVATGTALVALIHVAAIAGFFYAWVCSTMWGLDAAEPGVAVAAMQAMNASVRNAVFFPAFFLTPVALGIAAAAAWMTGRQAAAAAFGAAAAVYVAGAFAPTALVNVPMNEALATVAVGKDEAMARAVWEDYSAPWQAWNLVRTIASFLAVLLTGVGLLVLPGSKAPAQGAAALIPEAAG